MKEKDVRKVEQSSGIENEVNRNTSSVERARAMDTPAKLVSGMERSYAHTAWKSVMEEKTAPLSVTTWPSTIQSETSVCCVDSLDILLCNVGVCNTRSNPLQTRPTTVYPHTSLRLVLTPFKLFESGRLEG